MALAALYNRLFTLQDKRRDAELRIAEAEFTLEENYKAYRKLDRWVDSVNELKEIADDPEHRQYPNITEKTKLNILAAVRTQVRIQRVADLKISKLERDLAATERMIKEHLERRVS